MKIFDISDPEWHPSAAMMIEHFLNTSQSNFQFHAFLLHPRDYKT